MAAFDPVKVCEDLAAIQDKILDIVDELEDIQLAAEASSGKIKQLIPSNVMIAMDKLTAVVDGTSPDCLNQISELIQSMPLKDLSDPKKLKRSELRKQALEQKETAGEEFEETDLVPNTNQGPQSEIVNESALGNYVKGAMRQKRLAEVSVGGLSFDTLRETGLGESIDGDMMAAFSAQAGKSATMPSSAIPSSGKIRERINAKFVEDGEGIEATAGKLEEANILKFKNPGASIGMPGLKFSDMT